MKKNAALKAQAGQVWKTLSGTGSLGLTYRSITEAMDVPGGVIVRSVSPLNHLATTFVPGCSIGWSDDDGWILTPTHQYTPDR